LAAGELSDLANAAKKTFKKEIWKSLNLAKKDEQRTKRLVAKKVAEAPALVEEARLFLARGRSAQ